MAAEDSEDERRYTVAHEVAHFIVEYLEPRRRTVETIGEAGLEVLDGVRAPSDAERLRAIVAGNNLRVHVHLMDRDGGLPDAESRADRLAVEVLAPEDDTRTRLAAAADADPALVLRAAYGLPPGVASQYARWLAPPLPTVPGIWLLRRRGAGRCGSCDPPTAVGGRVTAIWSTSSPAPSGSAAYSMPPGRREPT